MQFEPIEAAQGHDEILEHTESSHRLTEIQQLYFAHYGELQSTIYQHCPQTLVWDADKILSSLAERLPRYAGPPTDAGFLRWGKAFVRREAERYQITTSILKAQRKVIHAAINRNRWTSATDASIEHDDVFSEVAALIFAKAHALNRRGTAKLSTRITALVKKHCYQYHNSRNGRRKKLIEKQIEQSGTLGVETLSPEEVASMRADSSAWDSGYSECGLSLE